jgi:hypothetical protein
MEITQYYKDIIEEEVNSSSGTKDIPSDLVNTDEIKNLSGGLRLRKIEQIRNELDNDFSAIARTKPKLSLLHSQNSLSEPQSDQSQLVVAGSNHLVSLDDSPTNDKNNTLAESSDSVSNAIPEASSDAQVKDSNFENAANSDIHDLNITGKLRTKFARNKNKRKSVPSWDEIMLSSNEVSKPNDRGARKSEND